MKFKLATTLLATTVIIAGCAGRDPNPVMVRQYGDENRSCDALEVEIGQIESEIYRLVPQTNKTGKNVALGVTGAFFIVPLFFMDLSNAEKVEVEAYRQRYNHLVVIATQKGCNKREIIQPFDQQQTDTPQAPADET